MNISDIDKNLAFSKIADQNINWINARDERFSLHGVY